MDEENKNKILKIVCDIAICFMFIAVVYAFMVMVGIIGSNL